MNENMRQISARRDRLSPKLAELARILRNPTPANVERVRLELERLANG